MAYIVRGTNLRSLKNFEAQFHFYDENSTPAILIFNEYGEEYLTATVNHPTSYENWFLPEDGVRTVFIKNWSENDGTLEALEANGIVRRHPSRDITNDLTTFHAVELVDKNLEQLLLDDAGKVSGSTHYA